MKNKKKGFLIIENIISLILITMMASLVVSVFSTSIFCLYKSSKKIEMLNLANKEICKAQQMLNDNQLEDEVINKTLNKFDVLCNIDKLEKFVDCYKISIIIKDEKEKIKLNSYVVKN